MDKVASAYQVLYGGQLDEETILHKCMNASRYIEKVDKEIGGGISSGIPFNSLWQAIFSYMQFDFLFFFSISLLPISVVVSLNFLLSLSCENRATHPIWHRGED